MSTSFLVVLKSEMVNLLIQIMTMGEREGLNVLEKTGKSKKVLSPDSLIVGEMVLWDG
jgi:hypothetical protein